MTITTKFKIGEEVFLMYNNSQITATVKMIKALTGSTGTFITYYIDSDCFYGLSESEKEFNESRLFKNKAALLNSL